MTLEEENIELKRQLAECEAERDLIVRNLKKGMEVLGLYPLPDEKNIKKTVLKTLSGIISDFTFNQKEVYAKFDFIKELQPLAKKYSKYE